MKFKTYDSRVQEAITLIKDHLYLYNVGFNIYLEEHLMEDWAKHQGEFGAKPTYIKTKKNGQLNIAVSRPMNVWFPILLHEYCHFQQWVDNDADWLAASGKPDSSNVMWEYIKGEREKTEFVRRHIAKVKAMELDCERRTCEMMTNYTHIKSREQYAKEAGAYIYFHDFIYKTGKWYSKNKGKRTLDSKEIVDLMPSSMEGDYEVMPKGLHKLFEECV
jgi:hypothetical protein